MEANLENGNISISCSEASEKPFENGITTHSTVTTNMQSDTNYATMNGKVTSHCQANGVSPVRDSTEQQQSTEVAEVPEVPEVAAGNISIPEIIESGVIEVEGTEEQEQQEDFIAAITVSGEESVFSDILKYQSNNNDADADNDNEEERVFERVIRVPRVPEKRKSDMDLINALEVLLNNSHDEFRDFKPLRLEYAESVYMNDGLTSQYSTLKRPKELKLDKVTNTSVDDRENNHPPAFEQFITMTDTTTQLESSPFEESFEEDKIRTPIPELKSPNDKSRRKPSKIRQILTCSKNKPADSEEDCD